MLHADESETHVSNAVYGVLWFVALIPSIVCHEVAHGYVAYRLGDPTAKMQGRLSLNPVKHIDPIGTIVLPLIMLAFSGGQTAFGWAKPVPINPRFFKDYRKGMFVTGLAGPAVNLVFALLGAVVYWLVVVVATALGTLPASIANLCFYLQVFAIIFSSANLVLLFLNLIPIPPLDGSRVLPLFLSDEALRSYHRFEQYGLMIFFLVIILLPQVVGIDPLGAYFGVTVDPLLSLLFGW